MNLKIIISDVDNTLVHKRDPQSDASSIKSGALLKVDRDNYVSIHVIAAVRAIRSFGVPFVLATSRRIETYLNVLKFIKPTFSIVEDGSLVLDEDGNIDSSWAKRLESFIGVTNHLDDTHKKGKLWEFRLKLSEIESGGKFKIIDKGFRASFKIQLPISIETLRSKDIQEYLFRNGIEIPDYLKISVNAKYQSVSIIPSIAGKSEAASYIFKNLDLAYDNAAFLGDDYNDVELLSQVGHAITLSSAQEDIKNLVSAKGGIVVPEGRHQGALAMLNLLIAYLGTNSNAFEESG